MPLFFLIGPSGSGKSHLAPLLATALGTRALDLDDEIAASAGRSIVEIFAGEGEQGFRARERAALGQAIAAGAGVVATGGGITQDAANRVQLRQSGRVVFLATTPATQLSRIGAPAERAQRPLLAAAPDLLARLDALYTARLDGYRAAAHLEIVTDASSPTELVTELVARLGSGTSAGR